MSAQNSDKTGKKETKIPIPTHLERIEQKMRNKSIEEYNVSEKRWTKVLSTSPKKIETPVMHKAKSFKVSKVVNDIPPESYSNKEKTVDNQKTKQRPSTNRVDSVKDLENSRVKPKNKTKKRC